MTDIPVELDKHRGMAAQKATDLRRALAEVENNVRSCANASPISKPPDDGARHLMA